MSQLVCVAAQSPVMHTYYNGNCTGSEYRFLIGADTLTRNCRNVARKTVRSYRIDNGPCTSLEGTGIGSADTSALCSNYNR